MDGKDKQTENELLRNEAPVYKCVSAAALYHVAGTVHQQRKMMRGYKHGLYVCLHV